jgi:hypothetical protein
MDPSLQPLLRQLEQLTGQFRDLRDGVLKAMRIAADDPEMALTRARKVLEYVIQDICRLRCGEEPGTRPLENLLQRLLKDGHLPKRLGAYANHIRELGNVGTHAHGEAVTADDVRRSLEDLTSILEWYFETVRPEALLPPTRLPLAAAPGLPFAGLADTPAPPRNDHESSAPALLPWWKRPGVVAVAAGTFLTLIGAVLIITNTGEQPRHGKGAIEPSVTSKRQEKPDRAGTGRDEPIKDTGRNPSRKVFGETIICRGFQPIDGKGSWRIDADDLVQEDLVKEWPKGPNIAFGDENWSSYDLTLRAKQDGGSNGFVIMFHNTDLRNTCSFGIGNHYNKCHEVTTTFRGEYGRNDDKDITWGSIKRDVWYDIHIEVREDRFRCFLNGERLFTCQDKRFTKGRIGLACTDCACRFRDIKVVAPDGTLLWSGLPLLPADH